MRTILKLNTESATTSTAAVVSGASTFATNVATGDILFGVKGTVLLTIHELIKR